MRVRLKFRLLRLRDKSDQEQGGRPYHRADRRIPAGLRFGGPL
jgi:hypothetical protein